MKLDEIFTSEDLRMLTDIGFIAASRKLTEPATSIFKIIETLRPEQEAGFLGSAIAALIQGDMETADKKLNQAPDSPTVEIFKALVDIQKGDKQQATQALKKVTQQGGDQTIVNLAEQILKSQSEQNF